MRPDLDDFEDLTPEGEEPRARAMSWVVLGVAITGFAALAYYAYQSGTQSVGDGNMMVVEAESGPVKEAPAEAGGEEFPHKDKTIYDAISPYRVDAPRKVEKLLPETEEPVIPEPAVSGEAVEDVPVKKETATTFVNKDVAEDASHSEVEVEDTPAEPVKEAVQKTEPVKEAPKKLEPVKEPVKEVKKEEPKPAPAATGDFKIQLGAYTSESEAQAAWKKISAKHGLTGEHTVVKAEVNGKTWYRLRTGGYAFATDAKAACAKLAAAKQACMFVGK